MTSNEAVGERRTATGAVECAASPDVVFDYLADPRHLTEWAPGFAQAVTRGPGPDWTVPRDGEEFAVRVPARRESGTVDFLREVAPGRWGGAFLRVHTRPGRGSVVVMTLGFQPGVDPADTARILQDELAAIAAAVDGA
jgi:uncharacterized protein YndB with AHSA1/START domain